MLGAASPMSQGDIPRPPSPEDAPIALLVDLSSGQTLFERESDRRFVPASITKVMTAMVAFEMIESRSLFPEQVMTVRPETFRRWSGVGSTMYLPHDARVRVDELLHGITTVSGNDASVVLAEGAAGSVAQWLAGMNATAAKYGMLDSHFNTPNGWMDEGQTFTTARDLVTLGSAMVRRHPSKYRHFFGAEGLEYNGITQRNHDPITGSVEGADGIKTGFTNQAGYGFLGSAERNGRRLMMVVAASPSGRARNSASRDLIEWGFANFDSIPLFEKGEPIAQARVQDGSAGRVPLAAQAPVRLSIPRDRQARIDLAVRYEGPLRAPIEQGEQVARLLISVDGEQVNSVPLVAQQTIGEANVLRRVFNGLLGWLA
ncbi:D-alanyl-D-alanine carboxypeptidase family protein [Qipengyuania sp. DY56-A-20]|uniref:serine-type D-Ala-D-Ala carboxypeptidase n=1 Tax=Qipengyuania benthica TaxID=3067651 RepID=A0ABT9H7C6_9SPHN|nr:D-alanyl-D-alanine carboxypeptidase family protein [Qipengyuania sp. DY56-A-20]MDP4539217.1 D-alanyl-D-alanine carboxypeptidase family protein [Qipengyuania sp. DY56-A-20]